MDRIGERQMIFALREPLMNILEMTNVTFSLVGFIIGIWADGF